LLVVLFVFWKDLLRIVRAVARLDFKSQDGKLGLYIVLGSIATAAVGFVFRDMFESYFHNLYAVGVAFIATGCFYSLLYAYRRNRNQGRPLSALDAVAIGVVQGMALIPGVSRSGSTITTGLLLKVEKEVALRFSFLLFIPAVIGAAVLSVIGSDGMLVAVVDPVSLLLGLVVTVVVGYVSLRLLLRVVMKGRLYLFAYYCWAIGSAVLLTQILGL
jgi:undecaprenyl-diphosphatase